MTVEQSRVLDQLLPLDPGATGVLPKQTAHRLFGSLAQTPEDREFVRQHLDGFATADGLGVRYREYVRWLYGEQDHRPGAKSAAGAAAASGDDGEPLEPPRREAAEEEGRADVDLERYTEAESIFAALETQVEGHHPVRLLRASWLLRQGGAVLRRRQELPEEAFLPAGELRDVWESGGRGGTDKVLPVVAISFCWDTQEHPDPRGIQLRLVSRTLRREMRKYRSSEEGCDFRGFSDMGVFWDWGSLLQGDPARLAAAKQAALDEGRSEEQAEEAGREAFRTLSERSAFRHALHQTMDLWYAHQGTTVYLLTQHPKERGSQREKGYEESGWTTYERCSAEQIKNVFRYEAEWDAVLDLGRDDLDEEEGAKAAGRRWPVGPDQFDALLESRTFTNGADRQAVKDLYRTMSRRQLGGVAKLEFDGMPKMDASDAERFGGCLSFCHNLTELDWDCIEFTPQTFAAIFHGLLPGALPRLSAVNTGGNPVGVVGVQAFADAVASGCVQRLSELDFSNSSIIGPEGLRALSTVVATPIPSHGQLPLLQLTRLVVDDNPCGDEGAAALARAVRAGALPALEELGVGNVRLGDAGLRALAEAGSAGAFAALKELRVENNSLSDAGVEAFAECAGNGAFAALTFIDLGENRAVGDAGLAALAKAAGRGALPVLEDLAVNNTAVSDAGAEALAAAGDDGALQALKRLALYETKVGDVGAQALACARRGGAFPTLKDVDLDDTLVTATGKQELHKCL